jgi:hypothetical protein
MNGGGQTEAVGRVGHFNSCKDGL